MNKDLIDLCRNTKALCCIILDDSIAEFPEGSAICVKLSNNSLVFDKFFLSYKLSQKSKKEENVYLVLRGLDSTMPEVQEMLYGLVKDREYQGTSLPQNCIIVFTISNVDMLKTINPDLYNLSITAF